MLVIGGIGDLDPDILYDLFHTKGGWNNGKCSFPDLDPLLERQRFETNTSERIRIVWEIQSKLSEYVPLLNTVHQQFIFAYRTDNFDGWVLGPFTSPDNYFSYMNVYSVKLARTPTPTTPSPSPTPTTPRVTPSPTAPATPTPPPTTTPAGPEYTWAIVGVVIAVVVIAVALVLLRRR
jgi:hypothetical protein